MNNYTIFDFNRQFPDDDACLEWVKEWRWPNGIFCDACQRITKHHRIVRRMSYSCQCCGHHVHPMAGTIYEKTRTPLRVWFHATFVMASTRCGISAKQLQRETGISYKTAWRIFKQLRTLLDDGPTMFSEGVAEIDETWIGGKRRYKRGETRPRNAEGGLKRGRRKAYDENKTIVVGIAHRETGTVRAFITPTISPRVVLPKIREYVMPSTTVYTDESFIYKPLTAQGYAHKRIHHAAKVYVMGPVHTQRIEGFWSLIKRGIGGVYHAVSAKYLQTYLDEYSFRYNHRNDERAMFETMMARVPALARRDGIPS
jgi:transposase